MINKKEYNNVELVQDAIQDLTEAIDTIENLGDKLSRSKNMAVGSVAEGCENVVDVYDGKMAKAIGQLNARVLDVAIMGT